MLFVYSNFSNLNIFLFDLVIPQNNFEFQKLKFEIQRIKFEIQRIKFEIQRFIFEFQK